MILLYLVITLLAIIAFKYLMIKMDDQKWNNGHCPRCGRKWRFYMKNPDGKRGYTCDHCGNSIWVSSNIDAYYNKENEF